MRIFLFVSQAIRTSGQSEEEGDTSGPKRLMSQEEKFRKVLVETIIRWGCEEEIESTDLGEITVPHSSILNCIFFCFQSARCSPCSSASTTRPAS